MNSNLDVEIYFTIPEGFREWASTVSTELKAIFRKLGYNPIEKQIILLQRTLYGLK